MTKKWFSLHINVYKSIMLLATATAQQHLTNIKQME